jgi:DNA-binding NarL/FixJ family response regulator
MIGVVNTTISILLVEDQSLIRSGLRSLLERESDLKIAGEAPDGEDAVRLVRELRPDIVLMDLKLPKMDGIEATGIIKKEFPTTEVIVLSVYEDDEYVFQAIQAGATGYILKDITPENLVRAIRAVHAGQTMIHPGIARKVLERLSYMARERAAGLTRLHSDGLTDREVQILVEMAKGASNKEVASKLFVSESTVKSHLRTIYRKVGVRDRAQAVAYAIRKGFIR